MGSSGLRRGCHGVRESCCEPLIVELGKGGLGLPRRTRTLCTQVLGRGLLTGNVYVHALRQQ